jgi:hypothetical protein
MITITSHIRGNIIFYDIEQGQWKYQDGEPVENNERPCVRCGKMPTKEGYDACLGHIDNVKSACCGHGVEEPYIVEVRS